MEKVIDNQQQDVVKPEAVEKKEEAPKPATHILIPLEIYRNILAYVGKGAYLEVKDFMDQITNNAQAVHKN